MERLPGRCHSGTAGIDVLLDVQRPDQDVVGSGLEDDVVLCR